jgi:hypothetical protein
MWRDYLKSAASDARCAIEERSANDAGDLGAKFAELGATRLGCELGVIPLRSPRGPPSFLRSAHLVAPRNNV